MLNRFIDKTHFIEWETKLDIELVIKTLFDEQVLTPNFRAYDWRSNINSIVFQLKEYLNWLNENDFKTIKLSILFKKTLLDYSKENIKRNYSDILLINWVDEKYSDLINDIIKFKNTKSYLESEIIVTLNNCLYLKDLTVELEIKNDKNIDLLYVKIREISRIFERLNDFIAKEWIFFKNNIINNNDWKINFSNMNIISLLKEIKNNLLLHDLKYNNELYYFLMHLGDFIRIDKVQDINFFKKRIKEEKEIYNWKEFWKIIDGYINILSWFIWETNSLLEKIWEINFLNKINENNIIYFNVSIRDFIPALISRIEIFWKDSEKNEFINKFSKKKNFKSWLAIIFLFISILLFWFVICQNFNLYKEKSQIFLECKNITIKNKTYCNKILLTPAQFISEFLSKNIYLFSIEMLSIILAFYFLWLFKTYRKVVELYDSHILLIESDFYYKNDQDLITWDEKTFELRKENTQKIHNLPEKAFLMLHWKESINENVPSLKLIDKFSEFLEIIIKKIK